MTTAERQEHRDALWHTPRARVRLILVGMVLANLVLVLIWLIAPKWEDRPFQIEHVDPTLSSIAFHFGCHESQRLLLEEETETHIRVRAQVKGDHLGDCLGGAGVGLDMPVGDRTIIDVVSGRQWRATPDGEVIQLGIEG